MKNKRNVLIAFILICALCLSIGYAALTDTLYVTGKASVNVLSDDDDPKETTPFEEKLMANVYWSEATATESSAGVTATTTTEAQSQIAVATDTTDTAAKPDVLVITVPAGVLTSEDDTTTVNATIKNESDYDISVTLGQATIADAYKDYFEVTWNWATGSTNAITEGGTSSVVITIKLKKAPINDIADAAFNITCTATATD